MDTDGRDSGLDVLRLLCMLMLATYHFLNYYGGQYVSMASAGRKALIVQNFLWGGGRMICNVFLYISAWFLCEKEFRSERIFKAWITVFVHSIAVGVIFYQRTGDVAYLMEHIFPISAMVLWYASMYIGILMLSPILNILLRKENRRLTRKVVYVFLVVVSLIPSFYPRYSYPGAVFSWFALAYLVIGLMKLEGIRIGKAVSLWMFSVGWLACLLFYNGYDRMMGNGYLAAILNRCGFYAGLYFANLGSLPCCLAALGLFFFFLQIRIPAGKILGGVLKCISVASLDVYIVASMEGPGGKLAWVELWDAGYVSANIFQCYVMIGIGIALGILVGNVREYIWGRAVRHEAVRHVFLKIDDMVLDRRGARLKN